MTPREELPRDAGGLPGVTSAEGPSTLYHYTNTAGLLGIVSSKVLHATDINFLNDTQEVTYARDVFVGTLREQRPSEDALAPLSEQMTRFRNAVDVLLARLADDPEFLSSHRIYVACLCGDPDLLSQWRGYGINDGFAIGFDFDRLHREGISVPETGGRAELRTISYGDEQVRGLINGVFRTMYRGDRSPVSVPGPDEQLEAMIYQSFAATKHPKFSQEAEHRMMLIDPDPRTPLRFRTGALGPTPYVELHVPPAFFKEVWIAPGPHQEAREKGVRQLLEAQGLLNYVDVHRSAIRYRSSGT